MEAWRDELYHHGILGQKWGVRRYQNSDGSLTDAGRKRYSSGEASTKSSSKSSTKTRDPERAKKIAKYAVAGALGAATITAAAIYVKQHPEAAMKVASMGNILSIKMSDLAATAGANVKNAGARAVTRSKNAAIAGKFAAKAYKENAIEGLKEGIYEGTKEAPKKFAKAVITGSAMLAGKKLVDEALGKETAAKIYQANNNKKIDKFWKVNDDRDKDDE